MGGIPIELYLNPETFSHRHTEIVTHQLIQDTFSPSVSMTNWGY